MIETYRLSRVVEIAITLQYSSCKSIVVAESRI